MTAEGDLLTEVCRLADDLRRDTVGDEVTYVVNRNINFTNICYVGCRFCAFAQRKTDADAFSLSLEQVADRAQEAWELGATEVCMQGGIDPELPASAYFDLVSAVKQRVPGMHVHAFSPMEIVSGAARTGLSIEDFLIKAREAGLDTIPGTAAEILDDEIRWVLTKGKLPTKTWIEVVTTAHKVGLRSSSTMMYGHVDNPRHWVQHLRVLRRIQDETGGFTEFVPLPFVHTSSPIYLAGVARPGPTLRDNLAVHAMGRIMLHGSIDNIQTSWVKLGVDGTRAMLQAGANDVGGTLMEETISRMAGSEHGSAKTVAELVEIGAGIGRPVVERTTDYGRADVHPDLTVVGGRARTGSCRSGSSTSGPTWARRCPTRAPSGRSTAARSRRAGCRVRSTRGRRSPRCRTAGATRASRLTAPCTSAAQMPPADVGAFASLMRGWSSSCWADAGHRVAVERVGVLVAGDHEPLGGRQSAVHPGIVVDVGRVGRVGRHVVGPEADLVVVARAVAVLGAVEDRRRRVRDEEVDGGAVDVDRHVPVRLGRESYVVELGSRSTSRRARAWPGRRAASRRACRPSGTSGRCGRVGVDGVLRVDDHAELALEEPEAEGVVAAADEPLLSRSWPLGTPVLDGAM